MSITLVKNGKYGMSNVMKYSQRAKSK